MASIAHCREVLDCSLIQVHQEANAIANKMAASNLRLNDLDLAKHGFDIFANYGRAQHFSLRDLTSLYKLESRAKLANLLLDKVDKE